MTTKRLEVNCPCCQAKLLLDRETGLVIHAEPQKTAYSFDDAVRREKERKGMSDELFAKAFADEKRRQETLEDKFKAALQSKDELDLPPPRPIDLD